MLCLSGFELYSRWVPLISWALKARECLFKNHPLTRNLFLSFFLQLLNIRLRRKLNRHFFI